MRLLFDQDLSPKLVGRLADRFPGSAHAVTLGLDCADDGLILEHARGQGYAIVTKDADSSSISVVKGSPPKVVWLLIGNCTTAQVEDLFRAHHASLDAFDQDPATGILCLR